MVIIMSAAILIVGGLAIVFFVVIELYFRHQFKKHI